MADLSTQLCTLKTLKYTKYSGGFRCFICVKISLCLSEKPFSALALISRSPSRGGWCTAIQLSPATERRVFLFLVIASPNILSQVFPFVKKNFHKIQTFFLFFREKVIVSILFVGNAVLSVPKRFKGARFPLNRSRGHDLRKLRCNLRRNAGDGVPYTAP